MPDGDPVGADADFLDHRAQDALTFEDRCGPGALAQPSEEPFQVVGEPEVGLLVNELGGQGLQLAVQVLALRPQRGDPLAQLVPCDQVLLVGADQAVDGRVDGGDLPVQPILAGVDRVGVAHPLQSAAGSARTSAGLASRAITCSHTRSSRPSARRGRLEQTRRIHSEGMGVIGDGV